jgi:integrase
MTKASAGTPQIKNSNGRLQIVLSKGGKRSYLSLGVPDNKQRVYVQMIATQIWNDILAGHFTGVEKYKRAEQTEPEQQPTGKKSDDTDINPFTPEERELIIGRFKSDGSHYAPLVEFLFRTGCRPSEAIALQIKHLGKEYRSITFCQSVTWSESGLKLKQGLKTQSQRVFPCGDDLRECLRSLVFDTLKEGIRPNPERFLFEPIKSSSKFINLDKFSYREWHKVLKSLGIADRGTYQCRHTYMVIPRNKYTLGFDDSLP